jgi:hypothetical protein
MIHGKTTWEIILAVFLKAKCNLFMDTTTVLIGIYSAQVTADVHTNISMKVSMEALFVILKNQNSLAGCTSIWEWIKICYIHLMEYCSVLKMNNLSIHEILTWVLNAY